MSAEPTPQSEAPSTLIVLVNWNGWRDSIACIQSCLALATPNVRIMLCDNASADGSVEHIRRWCVGEEPAPEEPFPIPVDTSLRPASHAVLTKAEAEAGADGGGAQLLIVPTGGNLGFAGGNNVGLRWAQARQPTHVWLLNNDTVVPADALDALIGRLESNPKLGLVGSLMLQFERPDLIQGLAGAIKRKNFRGRHLGTALPIEAALTTDLASLVEPGELVYPIGASILISRDFLNEIGPMHEEYFLYYEEADWILRSESRFAMEIVKESRVYHRMGSSTGSGGSKLSPRSVGYLFRSRLLAARRFAPGNMPFVIAGILDEAGRAFLKGKMAKPIGAWNALLGRVQPPVVQQDAAE